MTPEQETRANIAVHTLQQAWEECMQKLIDARSQLVLCNKKLTDAEKELAELKGKENV